VPTTRPPQRAISFTLNVKVTSGVYCKRLPPREHNERLRRLAAWKLVSIDGNQTAGKALCLNSKQLSSQNRGLPLLLTIEYFLWDIFVISGANFSRRIPRRSLVRRT
jgi:hypothetical protein